MLPDQRQRLIDLGWVPPGEHHSEARRLLAICEQAHDQLLRGDDTAEVLAALERAWVK